MGAFVAGVLLAVSPFAVQIRADIEPLKTILVTLFFAAVGMFGDLPWLVQNAGLVLAVVLALVLGKALLIALIVRSVGERTQFAVAGGLCLAQVGEFSFVLATIARGDGGEAGLLSETVFRAIVSATILSLLVTPYLITAAPHVGIWIERMLSGSRKLAAVSARSSDGDTNQATAEPRVRDSIFILGFGPAGQRAAEDLLSLYHDRIVVVDINPENIAIARRYGLRAHIGDATQREVLEHAGIHTARLVIITVPSPQTSRKLIHVVRYHAGGALLFVRARYHIHRWQLVGAGADVVVDEEDRVGHQLASEAAAALRDPANEAND
jgi:CPA2 family monovalent cation:H+ antiporter-2